MWAPSLLVVFILPEQNVLYGYAKMYFPGVGLFAAIVKYKL